MSKKTATNGALSLTDASSEENEVTVKDAIERINALYEAVCENADAVRKTFSDRGVKTKFAFYNNHAVAVGDGYVNELYPIPVVTVEACGVAADIGFDIVSRDGNIGFLDLTVDKAVLIDLDFTKITEFEFSIFGVEHYLNEYWFDDVEATKQMIKKSDEKQFHVGFEFSDMTELKKLLDAFFVVTSGVDGGTADDPGRKMLGEK